MNNDRFQIRVAKREDCKEICRLVQELATIMKSKDAEKLVPEALERDGFDTDRPRFKCIVVEDREVPGTLRGYVLYYPSYDAWRGKALRLENIHVSPEFQGKQLGTRLFTLVAKEACDEGYNKIDINVFSWNTATKFYEKLGAEDITKAIDLHLFRVDRRGIEALANK